MDKAIIIGAGKYGEVYKEYIQNKYQVIGFYDDDTSLHGHIIDSIEVKGSVQDALLKESNCAVFVPIGSNLIRVNILKMFKSRGFETPSYIHPTANIHSSVKIGEAVYVLPSTNIMPLTEIGDYTMISMGVNIAHHCIIEEGCFFSQGTNIGASIHIKEYAYVGIASTLMTGVKSIGSNCLIGAGSVVIKDVPDNAIMVGVPAKILKYK